MIKHNVRCVLHMVNSNQGKVEIWKHLNMESFSHLLFSAAMRDGLWTWRPHSINQSWYLVFLFQLEKFSYTFNLMFMPSAYMYIYCIHPYPGHYDIHIRDFCMHVVQYGSCPNKLISVIGCFKFHQRLSHLGSISSGLSEVSVSGLGLSSCMCIIELV